MLQKIIIYGLIAGVFVGAVMFAVTVVPALSVPAAWSMAFGYLNMLVALSAVFIAIKKYRDVDLGGVIGFWRAFALGLGVSIVAGVLYVVAWEAALAYLHLDFGAVYANSLIKAQEAKGVTGQAMADFTMQMEQFKANYAKPLYRYGMTFTEIFPVGVLVSLISAALLRNPRFLAPTRRA
jgi:hypothetical protein